jgi:hypothetical protein
MIAKTFDRDQAAETIRLPAVFAEAATRALANSMKSGKFKEYQYFISRDLEIAFVREGDANSVWSDYPKGSDVIAKLHTHPGNGWLVPDFPDVANLANSSPRMTAMVYGDRITLLCRTRTFDDVVTFLRSELRDPGGQIRADFGKAAAIGLDPTPAQLREAGSRAIRAVVDKYGLVYYEGKIGGTLTRVNATGAAKQYLKGR